MMENQKNKILKLYWDGDECVDVTGGWVTGWTYGKTYSQSKEKDYLYINVQTGTQHAISWMTQKQIDISGYTKLCVLASTDSLKSGFGFGLYVGYPANTWNEIRNVDNGATAYGLYPEAIQSQYKENISISSMEPTVYTHQFNLTGLNRINLSDYGQGEWKIYQVWLE